MLAERSSAAPHRKAPIRGQPQRRASLVPKPTPNPRPSPAKNRALPAHSAPERPFCLSAGIPAPRKAGNRPQRASARFSRNPGPPPFPYTPDSTAQRDNCQPRPRQRRPAGWGGVEKHPMSPQKRRPAQGCIHTRRRDPDIPATAAATLSNSILRPAPVHLCPTNWTSTSTGVNRLEQVCVPARHQHP